MPPVLAADTSLGAGAVPLAAWRAMSAADKLALVREATIAVLWLEREGLRRRHPSLDAGALHEAAIVRRLGHTLADQVYPNARRAP